MTEQQGNPRRSFALAIALFIAAAAAFGVAFYMLDGYALIQEITDGETVEAVDGPGNVSETTSQVATDTLTAPDGMPAEFALRLWQEQVDSQSSIEMLLGGDVEVLRITDTSVEGDTADLSVEVSFADSTSAPGLITMIRFADAWYMASISGLRDRSTGGMADAVGAPAGAESVSELPSIEEVDVEILNTMLAEQAKSAPITEKYVNGEITEVSVTGTDQGPNSATVSVEMSGADGVSTGDVIAVLGEADETEVWFIVRFTESESDDS